MTRETLRDPASYNGSPVCMRCGSGWPCCADPRPDGSHYSHDETCARYAWSYALCGRCSLEMAQAEAGEQRRRNAA